MTQVTLGQGVLDRLGQLRRKVRMLLAAHGVGYVLAIFGATGLVLALLDYMFEFRAWLRISILLVVLGALAYLVYRLLVMPLTTKLSDEFLAGRIERSSNSLSDELTTAVEFVATGAGQQNALAAELLTAAEQKASALDLGETLEPKRVRRALVIGAVSVALLGGLAGLNFSSGYTGLALQRWFTPLGAPQWPRTVEVELDWTHLGGKAPSVWPQGESLPVRAQVIKGHFDNQRVWVESTNEEGKTNSELMNQQNLAGKAGATVYENIIDVPSGKLMTLRVAAGDDTDNELLTIRLAPRPVLSGMTALIAPPPYVKIDDQTPGAKPYNVDLLAQPGRAVEGSRVRLLLKTTKPLGVDNQGMPKVRFLEMNRDAELAFGYSRKLADNNTAEISFTAEKSLQARVLVEDADGFENRVGGTLVMEVLPDANPMVVLVEPRRQVQAAPTSKVEVKVQATDDMGLDDVYLIAEAVEAKPDSEPKFKTTLKWQEQSFDPAAGGLTGTSGYKWDLTSLNLQPGERLNLYAMVRDNYEVPDVKHPGQTLRHPYVKSAPVAVIIRSEEQIRDALRADLQAVREQIKNLLNVQNPTHNNTKTIEKTVAETNTVTEQQSQQLGDLASQQANHAQRAQAIANQLKQIENTAKQNNMQESELGKLATEANQDMKDVAEKNMPNAAQSLNKAQEASKSGKSSDSKPMDSKPSDGKPSDGKPSDSKPSDGKPSDGKPSDSKSGEPSSSNPTAQQANNAAKEQEKAITSMENLLNKLAAAGDFEAMRADVNKALEDQKKLNQEVRDTARETIGKDAKELSKDLQAKLDKLAKEQQKQAENTAKMTDKMEKSAQAMQASDPASSQAMSKAAQKSRENNVSGKQAQASKSAKSNQMNQASNSGNQAQQGLQEMKDELDEQNRLQLEQLAAQLAKLAEQLKVILEQEVAIFDDTTKAGAEAKKAALNPLGERQGKLQSHVIAFQARVESTLREARIISRELTDSVDAMTGAAVQLVKGSQPNSLKPEQDAIAALTQALEKLNKKKAEAENKLKEENLAQLIKKYEAVKAGQETIKVAAEAIDAQRDSAGDLPRVAGAKLVELADSTTNLSQKSLIEQVDELNKNPELAKVKVITWVNRQVLDYMADSKQKLAKKEVGLAMSRLQQTTINRLDDIINALKEEKKEQEKFQKEGGGCLLYTSPSPRDRTRSRMPSSA